MTKLVNLKGMTVAEVKEVMKKERRVGKRDWYKLDYGIGVEYSLFHHVWLTVDENNTVTKVEFWRE